MVIKTVSAFHVEGFQAALLSCPPDFGPGAARQPLAQEILCLWSGVKCVGDWVLKSAFIIKYGIVIAVMQKIARLETLRRERVMKPPTLLI